MNALVDALISHPGESIVVTSALVLLVILLLMVRVAASWRADRFARQVEAAPPRYAPPPPVRRPIPSVSETRVMVPFLPVRPDDMTALLARVSDQPDATTMLPRHQGGRRG